MSIKNSEDMTKNKKSSVITNIIIILVSIVITAILSFAVYNQYIKPDTLSESELVDEYVKCFFNSDAKSLLNLLDEDTKKSFLSDYDNDEESLISALQQEFDASKNNLIEYYGSDYEYKYDMGSVIEASEDDITAYIEAANELGYENFNPTAIKEIQIVLTITYNSETAYENLNIAIAQLDGKWYIIGFYNEI